jgi:hypothetical protein
MDIQCYYLSIKATLGYMYKSNALAGRNDVSKESVSMCFFKGPTLFFSETVLGVRIRHWIHSTSDFHVGFPTSKYKICQYISQQMHLT